MNRLEIEETETLNREEVAKRLHALADALARHNEIEFDRGGAHFRLKVPDEVRVQVELEIDDDGTELEIELTWSSRVGAFRETEAPAAVRGSRCPLDANRSAAHYEPGDGQDWCRGPRAINGASGDDRISGAGELRVGRNRGW